MSDYALLDDDNNIFPIDIDIGDNLHVWGQSMQDHQRKRVARDEFGRFIVSTVFLGLNHRFGFERDLWFETMVFNPSSHWDEKMMRYTTWDEAAKGHQMFVDAIKDGLTPDELYKRLLNE